MAVLGIDVGTQNSVLATINRGSVCVVRTELADRLTPSLVLFSQTHRLMGDHAAPLVKSQARSVCRSFKNLLGEVYSESPRVQREKLFELSQIEEAEGGLAGFKVSVGDREEVLCASRVFAAFLTKLKQVAEVSIQRPVGEVVIACPSWFREANREALLQAAEIAGLTCLRVISDMTAVALDYGLYRRQHFSDEKTVVAFVSVGHAAASVSIAAFTSAGGEVLSQVSNPDLGGRDLDRLIAEHFAKAFERQHGTNPMNSLKARLKLEEQAERTKKVLSANSETTFSVECLLEDRDISGVITRDLFEELCAETFKPRLVQLLQQAIALSGLSASEISFVEAVGGCTRIPWVQRTIGDVFGREVSRTLSGDECVARGCALQAAMASLHFKVREFDFGEKLWHPISLTWRGSAPVSFSCCSPDSPGAATASSSKQQQETATDCPPAGCQELVLQVGTPTNSLRKISFHRDCPFELHAAYKDLRKDNQAANLGGCLVEVPPGVGCREVHVFCAVNYNGLIRFTRACMKPIDDAAATATSASAAAAADSPPAADADQQQQQQQQQQTGEGASSAEAPSAAADSPQQQQQQQQQQRSRPIELQLRPLPCAGRLSAEAIRVYREVELEMCNADRMHREKQDRMNELETRIYSLRDGLGGPLGPFASEQEKQQAVQLLQELEDWVYDHQDDPQLSKSTIVSKIDTLRALSEPIEYRQQQKSLRATAAASLRHTIQESRQATSCGDFSHVGAEKLQQLLEAAEADEAWLSRVMAEAEALPMYSTPAVSAAEIEQRKNDLDSFAKKILNTPKPKPPSPPPAASGAGDDDPMEVEGDSRQPPEADEPMASEHEPREPAPETTPQN